MTSEVLKERMEKSRTKVTKMVFPNTTNHYHTLFGGTAMELMDETAFISATRFCRKKVVTISSGRIDFKKPIPADSIIELEAQVIKIGHTSLDVKVDIYREQMYENDIQTKSISGVFTFVALDEDNKPIAVL